MSTVLIGLSLLIVGGALDLLWWDQRRTVAPNDAARRAVRHAAYTSAVAVACLAGGLLAAVGVESSGVPSGLSSAFGGPGRLLAVLPAAAGALFIVAHAIGDLTWPGPQGRQREAELQIRTVSGLAPSGLARWTWTMGALLVVATVVFGLAASGPRTLSRVLEDGHTYTLGSFPGWWFGVPVLICTIVVALACGATLRVIAARSAVAGMSSDWDRWLRRRSARRVLRGSQLVACLTLAGMSQFAGTAIHTLGLGDTQGFYATSVNHGYVVVGTIISWLALAVLAAGTLVALVPVRDHAPDPEAAVPSTERVAP